MMKMNTIFWAASLTIALNPVTEAALNGFPALPLDGFQIEIGWPAVEMSGDALHRTLNGGDECASNAGLGLGVTGAVAALAVDDNPPGGSGADGDVDADHASREHGN